ncbi:MAG: DrmB family protein, partial [Angustibacter sp.]
MLNPSGRRPDLARVIHLTCPKATQKSHKKRIACVPARFVVVCEAGHLDDFPYSEFVHQAGSTPCPGAQLSLYDSSSMLSPQVTVVCHACPGGKSTRNIAQAAGLGGAQVLPKCRGRHPHLRTFEQCGLPLGLAVLGSSNLWFSVTASALHLPEENVLDATITEYWELLAELVNPSNLTLAIASMPQLSDLRQFPLDRIFRRIADYKSKGGPPPARLSGDLLEAEWKLLCHPTTEYEDVDFKARQTPSPPNFDWLLKQVVQVKRLREVQALIGFTRLSPPQRRDLTPENRIKLSRAPESWVPAVENRGEGLFFELPEERVAAWADRATNHPRMQALAAGYRRWCKNRDQDPLSDFPIARYVLLHTLSHLLIRQMALECGYSSASIRERIYCGVAGRPAAGILLSTAA